MSVAWAKVNQCEDRYVEGNRAAWKALEDVTDELKEQNQVGEKSLVCLGRRDYGHPPRKWC